MPEGWAARTLSRRRAEQQDLIDRARRYASALPDSLGVEAVVVVGSVARGDFNVWSDVDVLVVARNLPVRPQDRLTLVGEHAGDGVQPLAWTPEEFARMLAAGNPLAAEAAGTGVVVSGSLRRSVSR